MVIFLFPIKNCIVIIYYIDVWKTKLLLFRYLMTRRVQLIAGNRYLENAELSLYEVCSFKGYPKIVVLIACASGESASET